jgi:hypothetical protein
MRTALTPPKPFLAVEFGGRWNAFDVSREFVTVADVERFVDVRPLRCRASH